MPKKRSASFVEDSDDLSTASRPSAPKKTKKTASTAPASEKDDDGNVYWELSNKRRVGLSEFKNMSFVNIREYYEKDGKTLPGKKGISLSIDQYAALLKAIPSINAALRERGHEFNEPDSSIADEPVVSKKAKKEKPSKANIEATSEEDN